MDAYAVMVYFRVVDADAILRRYMYCKIFPYIVNTYFLGVFPMCGQCVDYVWTMQSTPNCPHGFQHWRALADSVDNVDNGLFLY